MKNYDQYREDVGYYQIENVEKQYKYYAYLNGESSLHDSLVEALKVSKNTEKVCVNKEEYAANVKAFQEIEDRAQTAWMKDLREEYSNLSDEVFNLCYAQSYEDGHSAGYDEVRNCMFSVTEFAEKILACK